MTVELHDAGTKLSELADTAANGEEVILVRAGKPVARLTKLGSAPSQKRVGLLEGVYVVPDDIKTPFKQEIDELFAGDSQAE